MVYASNFSLKLTEKQIENAILNYLEFRKIFCWKVNTVGVYDQNKGVYRRPNSKYIISGVSDIIGIFKSKKTNQGYFLAIEVKTPQRKNNVSESQKLFLKNVNDNGGIGFVATSVKDVMQTLDKY